MIWSSRSNTTWITVCAIDCDTQDIICLKSRLKSKNRLDQSPCREKKNKRDSGVALYPTCDLGFDLALHLQRVDEDAAVPDEAGAGDASVRLAESLFFNIIPVAGRKQN